MTTAQPQERVLSTLNADGSRRWLRPRVSRGRYLRWRRVVAYVLILIFTLVPYLTINGKPMILLDVAARRFTLFGRTFLPTDTLLLALLLVGVFVTIFLLTALFGRVWCGWACPQTVYMEFVFRPIERLFGGAPGRSRKSWLARQPFAPALKYAAYLIISLYLAHTFLAYFVGVERLAQWVTRSPLEHPAGFLIVASVTALMMFDFCFFREQTCILACPYGRFQAALLDRNSLIISYDAKRGEPRGKLARRADVSLPVIAPGDCVDCGMCVTTCPTGIDIRGGLQMECIACAQCIDACDAVMAKVGRAPGLIRYTSQAALEGAKASLLRPRVILYPIVLTIVLSAFVLTLALHGPARVTVLRGVGAPFIALPGDEISNNIRVRIANRLDEPATFTLEATGIESARVVAEVNPVTVAPAATSTVPMAVIVPSSTFINGRREVTIVITGAGGFRREVTYTLQGPRARAEVPTNAPTQGEAR